MNGLCGEEEEGGEEEMMGGVQLVRWLRGYRPVVASASMTTGQRGHSFTQIHTHTQAGPHLCSCAHLCLESDVIRIRVISSASLLFVQTKMSKTNGGYLIIWVKDDPQ